MQYKYNISHENDEITATIYNDNYVVKSSEIDTRTGHKFQTIADAEVWSENQIRLLVKEYMHSTSLTININDTYDDIVHVKLNETISFKAFLEDVFGNTNHNHQIIIPLIDTISNRIESFISLDILNGQAEQQYSFKNIGIFIFGTGSILDKNTNEPKEFNMIKTPKIIVTE